MYKQLAVTALFALFCFLLAGCSKDAEFNAFIAEFEAVSNDIVKTIEKNPTAGGVDEAQKAFNAKKPGLKEKFDSIKTARGMQVSESVQKKFMDSVTKNLSDVAGLQVKYMSQSMGDAVFKSKLDTLIKDYTGVFEL